MDVWRLAGVGQGNLTLTQHPGTDRENVYRSDISMRRGAVGTRGNVLSPAKLGDLALSVKADAFWVRTESGAVHRSAGNMAASEADVSRLRLLLEGSHSFETSAGTLTPSLNLGLRHDGGDAETGTGVEAGAGLRYGGEGFSVEG